jgi:hypothetical protein
MIEGKLLPFTRSIVTQVIFLTFLNHIHHSLLFVFLSVRRLNLRKLNRCIETNQTIKVFFSTIPLVVNYD